MTAVIEAVSSGVPTALIELRRLGRTLKRRAADILAYFDRPGTSNGPTEAINGRLEHLRGSGDRRIQTPTTPPIVKSHYTTDLQRGKFRPRGNSSGRVSRIAKGTPDDPDCTGSEFSGQWAHRNERAPGA